MKTIPLRQAMAMQHEIRSRISAETYEAPPGVLDQALASALATGSDAEVLGLFDKVRPYQIARVINDGSESACARVVRLYDGCWPRHWPWVIGRVKNDKLAQILVNATDHRLANILEHNGGTHNLERLLASADDDQAKRIRSVGSAEVLAEIAKMENDKRLADLVANCISAGDDRGAADIIKAVGHRDAPRVVGKLSDANIARILSALDNAWVTKLFNKSNWGLGAKIINNLADKRIAAVTARTGKREIGSIARDMSSKELSRLMANVHANNFDNLVCYGGVKEIVGRADEAGLKRIADSGGKLADRATKLMGLSVPVVEDLAQKIIDAVANGGFKTEDWKSWFDLKVIELSGANGAALRSALTEDAEELIFEVSTGSVSPGDYTSYEDAITLLDKAVAAGKTPEPEPEYEGMTP